jgi:F0F1-type ATP synthase gamma subunit
MVRRLILPSSKRPDSVKKLFLVTDAGESNLGGSPKKAADILKKDVEIDVIGIGKKVRDAYSLRQLASKYENVFSIRSYKDLNKVKKMIVSMPVKGKQDYHLKTDKIS